MATSNFYKDNASRYFVVTAEDDMEADYKIEDIKETLKSYGYDIAQGNKWSDRAQKLAYKSMDVYLEGDEEPLFMVELIAILRYGYYEHASLDWKVTVHSNYTHWEHDIDEANHHIEEEIEYLVERGYIDEKYMGMVSDIQSRVRIIGDTIIEECENIFTKLSDHELKVKARFSNGETWYEEVNR